MYYCCVKAKITLNFILFQGKDEFLGSSIVAPSIRHSPKPPELDWIEIVRCNKLAGEVLAAFELLQEVPPEPPNAEPQPVPKDIAPKQQKMRIEVSHCYPYIS